MAQEVITEEQLLAALPKHQRSKITADLVDTINQITGDETFREAFRDNLVSYTSVMDTGKYKITSYVDACKYISHKLLGSSNLAAYVKTFPDRYKRLLAKGTSNDDISSYVAAYNSNQLVNKVREQTMVPTHVLNADHFQGAINTQVMISTNPEASFKVRSDAANSLLTHLKRPEVAKIELDVAVKQSSGIDELRAAAQALVQEQKRMIELGTHSAKDIAHSSIIEGELVNE